jgi:hypothetical protein
MAAPPSVTTLITATGNGTLDINPYIAAGHKTLRAQLLAGGTGAGSGRRGLLTSVICAGGPGASGAFTDVMLNLAEVLARFPTGLVPYNVGPGTAGGAAVTADDTNGNPGATPVLATNSTWLGAATPSALCLAIARVGTAGAGGTNATGTAGTARPGTAPNATSSSASTTGGAGAGTVDGGVGVGGGITAAGTAGAGSAGSSPLWGSGVSGTGGVVAGAAPTSGTIGNLTGLGATPGGGAASVLAAAQAGANALANSGAGGGSGGASLNGFDSGAGGNGGSGFARFTAMG